MISYSMLRDIQKKEMDSAAIVKLDESFYSEVANFIEEKKRLAKESGSLLSIKEYENVRKIVSAIQVRREEKIVLMAVRGESDPKGLTKEENGLLKDLCKRIDECRQSISDIWNRKRDGPETKKVRILKDIEPYTGLDKKAYGPFKNGEEPLLPLAEAEWLLKSRMAEVL